MTRRSACLAAWVQSTQLDSHSNLLTSEVNNGGGPYGATDDDDQITLGAFVSNLQMASL